MRSLAAMGANNQDDRSHMEAEAIEDETESNQIVAGDHQNEAALTQIEAESNQIELDQEQHVDNCDESMQTVKDKETGTDVRLRPQTADATLRNNCHGKLNSRNHYRKMTQT